MVLKSRSSKLKNLNSSVPNEDKRQRQPTKPEQTSHEESKLATKTDAVLARVQVSMRKRAVKKLLSRGLGIPP